MHVSAAEVARRFSEFLNRVACRGESFLLVRGNKVLAELRPAPRGRRLGELPALFRALPRLKPEDAAAFDGEVAAERKRLNLRAPRAP